MLENNADDSVDDPVLNRVCRYCSVQTTSGGAFCPNCGKPFEKSGSKKNKIVWVSGSVLAIALLIAGGLFVSQQITAKKAAEEALSAQVAASSSAAASSSSAAAEAAVAAAAESAAASASQDTERSLRKLYVAELETSIERDAKERVKKGSLTGPIKRVDCVPTGGGSLDDLTSLTTTFECIAVNETNKDKTESGYVFTSTMNWDEGSYSWRLGR